MRETVAYGPTAALIRVASALEAADLAAWLRARVSAVDIVPGAETVLVDGVPAGVVADLLTGFVPGGTGRPAGDLVTLPVVFDGPDLPFVAELWGVPVADAVARLTAVELTSAFCGFAPGFAYLTGLPASWAVPRLEAPRARVEPGSVALAGEWCGVYPSASPGGWRIVGHTDAVLWDVDRPSPALLAPGTRVGFRAAS